MKTLCRVDRDGEAAWRTAGGQVKLLDGWMAGKPLISLINGWDPEADIRTGGWRDRGGEWWR